MISIIVTFYNSEKYLEKCLASIKSQTFSDYECLMIDDGSTDNSREIAKKFLDDSRFRLLGDKHIGYPLCKNLGLDSAKGDFVCFIDSDDYVESYHLENLYNALIQTDSDISNCRRVYNESNFKKDIGDLHVYDDVESILLQYLNNTYPWNKLFKKSLFDDLRFDDVEALSDTLLGHKIFERARKTVYTKCESYHYRIHNESITYNVRNYSKTYWLFRLNVYLSLYNYLSKYSKLKNKLNNILRDEYKFCLPHLTKEQIDKFNQNPLVNILL